MLRTKRDLAPVTTLALLAGAALLGTGQAAAVDQPSAETGPGADRHVHCAADLCHESLATATELAGTLKPRRQLFHGSVPRGAAGDSKHGMEAPARRPQVLPEGAPAWGARAAHWAGRAAGVASAISSTALAGLTLLLGSLAAILAREAARYGCGRTAPPPRPWSRGL